MLATHTDVRAVLDVAPRDGLPSMAVARLSLFTGSRARRAGPCDAGHEPAMIHLVLLGYYTPRRVQL
jgi:hypothetical protein